MVGKIIMSYNPGSGGQIFRCERPNCSGILLMKVVLSGDDLLKLISELEVNNIVWICNNPAEQETDKIIFNVILYRTTINIWKHWVCDPVGHLDTQELSTYSIIFNLNICSLNARLSKPNKNRRRYPIGGKPLTLGSSRIHFLFNGIYLTYLAHVNSQKWRFWLIALYLCLICIKHYNGPYHCDHGALELKRVNNQYSENYRKLFYTCKMNNWPAESPHVCKDRLVVGISSKRPFFAMTFGWKNMNLWLKWHLSSPRKRKSGRVLTFWKEQINRDFEVSLQKSTGVFRPSEHSVSKKLSAEFSNRYLEDGDLTTEGLRNPDKWFEILICLHSSYFNCFWIWRGIGFRKRSKTAISSRSALPGRQLK